MSSDNMRCSKCGEMIPLDTHQPGEDVKCQKCKTVYVQTFGTGW